MAICCQPPACCKPLGFKSVLPGFSWFKYIISRTIRVPESAITNTCRRIRESSRLDSHLQVRGRLSKTHLFLHHIQVSEVFLLIGSKYSHIKTSLSHQLSQYLLLQGQISHTYHIATLNLNKEHQSKARLCTSGPVHRP